MPNDAKLGLIVGVSLVLVLAVVFFRREPTMSPSSLPPAATVAPQDHPAEFPPAQATSRAESD